MSVYDAQTSKKFQTKSGSNGLFLKFSCMHRDTLHYIFGSKMLKIYYGHSTLHVNQLSIEMSAQVMVRCNEWTF